MAAPSISVVVVTWNSAGELAELLPTLEAHLPFVELIVVDNHSDDATVATAEGSPAKPRIVSMPGNQGFGAAANVGVRAASASAVVLLNPDTLLLDESLGDLARLALETGAICGPELKNPDGSRQPSASPRPGGLAVVLDAVLPAALLPGPLRERFEPWRARRTTDVAWLTGACLAGPRDLLLELGPFDERIHLYGEDLDLGLRAGSRGIRSLYAPDVARVVHHGGRSAKRRFADAGEALKMTQRRAIVARRLGRRRERCDFVAQVLFHSTRYAAKRALRQDAGRERSWLAGALH